MKVTKGGEVQRMLGSFVVMVSVQGLQCSMFTKLTKYLGMKKMCVNLTPLIHTMYLSPPFVIDGS